MQRSHTDARPFRWMLTTLLICAIVFSGCGGDESGDESAGDVLDAGDPSITIEEGDRSPAITGAAARFTSPEAGAVLESGADVMVTVDVDSFEAGIQTETPRADAIANSENGQHVHIIVDGGPYYANYEPGSPFDIGMLPDGAHSAIVFPSRSYHEGVKNAGAMDFVNFYVGEEVGTFPLDSDQPTIIYSRPKGTYTGAAAERIMLDFFLHNVALSENGYTARYQIREEGGDEVLASTTLHEWTPSFVEGLPDGTYEIRLELLAADGNVVPGPLNTTNRVIEVKKDEG